MSRYLLCAATLIGTLLVPSAGLSATAPDAGQTLRRLEKPIPTLQPSFNPQAQREVVQGPRQIVVKKFVVRGNRAFSTDELLALIASQQGKKHNLASLKLVANRITEHYRAAGYFASYAFLPPQEVINGVVTLEILEGTITAVKIDNKSDIRDQRVERTLGQQSSVNSKSAEQVIWGLNILSETAGVGKARAYLTPGDLPGTSNLQVEVTPGARFNGWLAANNFGNYYSGQHQLLAGLTFNNPFRAGDTLSLLATTTEHQTSLGRLGYEFPLGYSGWRMGVEGSIVDYQLGEEFEQLDAHGTAINQTIYTRYPLIRSTTTKLDGILRVHHKELEDHISALGDITRKRLISGSLTLSGSQVDDFWGGGQTLFDLSIFSGELDILTDDVRTLDELTAGTQGGFNYLSYSLERMQVMPFSTWLNLSLNGQWSTNNLDSSERMSVGGPNAIRSYPEGEGIGDYGHYGQIELHHRFGRNLSGFLFFDRGRISFRRDNYTGLKNYRWYSGAGIGTELRFGNFNLTSLVAWRLTDNDPIAIPLSEVDDPVIWISLSSSF